MKANIIMLSPGEFSETDACLKKRWQHAQHVAGEFSKRWKLQSRQIRKKKKQNFSNGYIVLLNNGCQQNQEIVKIADIDIDAKKMIM